MERNCHVCGEKVILPRKVDPTQSGKNETVSCPRCGAKAPLRVKRRNGNVRGLGGCFIPQWPAGNEFLNK